MFQVAQAAVDDSGRPADYARGEIVLLHQQGAFPGSGALPCHGDAVDSAADDDDVEMLAF